MLLKLSERCSRFSRHRIFYRKSHEYNRHCKDGTVHVTSVNDNTMEKVMLRLSETDQSTKHFSHPTKNNLPKKAVQGLRNALVTCTKRTPKQLQNEADQRINQLDQRKMPASPQEIQEARDSNMFNKYKWKPISFKSREECASYALAILPKYYAEAHFVLDELDRFQFKPESILDFGSGVGSVFWAAHRKWNNILRDYSMVDPNEIVNHFAMDIMRNEEAGTLIAPYVNFRKSIVSSVNKKYDLVIAQRVLSEFDSHESRTQLIKLLWEKTNKYLILIESPLDGHFTALMHARAYIVLLGLKFDTKELMKYLTQNGLLTTEIKSMLEHKDASLFEKYNFLKNRNIKVQTELERGHVVAPCPHDSGCPLQTAKDFKSVCSHTVSYDEIRADGRTKSKGKDGTLSSKFTYVIFCKGERPEGHSFARLLNKKSGINCLNCKLCTSFEGLQHFQLKKHTHALYDAVDATNKGCLFPLEEKVVASDSEIHFVRELIKEAQESN